jgi:hypothetical protein
MIETIRADIPSGEDADGWSKVCRNWRSGGAAGAAPAGSMYNPRAPPSGRGGQRGGHSGHSGHSGHNGNNSGHSGNNSNSGGNHPGISSDRGHKTWDTRKTMPAMAAGDAPAADDRPRFINSGPALASAPTTDVVYPMSYPTPTNKYVSRFKSATEPVESTIVNTIILNKLNKFSPANYDECKEFLMEILGSGETDFLADFMRLVFRKAAAEETFCPLYAQLLNDLAIGYPFLLNEMAALYEKFMDIFQEVDEGAHIDMEEFIQKNKEKKYRKGYAQFLAELLKYNIVEREAFAMTLRKIIQQLDAISRQEDKSNTLEEYADCLICILNALKGTSAAGLAMKDAIRADALEQLMPLTARSAERPSLTNRIRFTILNATDHLKA